MWSAHLFRVRTPSPQCVCQNCKEDPNQEAASILVGIGHLVHAAIRLSMSTAVHVADLVHTMWLLVLMDTGHVYMLYVHGKKGEGIPLVYIGLVGGAFLYEVYVLVVARRALKARNKNKICIE